MAEAIEPGRESFRMKAWRDAYVQLSAADEEQPLEIEDLERLAVAAHLVGQDDEATDALARVHQECLRLGETARAGRCAFWLGFGLLLRGDESRGGGWLSRARRLLGDSDEDCRERGYVLVSAAVQSMVEGDASAAFDLYDEAAKIGARFGDQDLVTFALCGAGEAMVALGDAAQGGALLDEVMVAVTADEVSPVVAGIVYCAVIAACEEIFDLRRAQQWTAALSRWCESQPDLVPYRGQCLVHRAEIMQWHGEWPDALEEARRACVRLAGQPAAGAALYVEGELHRLRGEFAAAEEAYREANKYGRQPQPGLAQLRLAQGHVDAAYSAIRRLVDEPQNRVKRVKVLAAFVEIALAANDSAAARHGADELTKLALEVPAPPLLGISAEARGMVLLAEGDPRSAIAELRRAWAVWREVDAPYEAARVRVHLGQAYQELGDLDSAEMERDAARWVFQQLAAGPDLASLEQLPQVAASTTVGGLTDRELQVLVHLAAGKTNRDIAAELVISEHTVARHVQNIFAKLGVSSRTAASAYAFGHGLV
ncbi:MAG: LuxR C-terminal-related transcriptional regulator [Actinomycetota bacterium]|nr:LuxR C-terminal-related transcriptional regulator [Actinomycetota bacterium]